MSKSKQIKNNRITLRFINDLFDKIAAQAEACNSTATVYLQNLIARAIHSTPTQPTPVNHRDRDLDLYRAYLLWHQEYRKQGNNLNQITKAIHAANLDDRMVDPTNCLRVLSSIAKTNQEIAAAIAKLEL
jgi:Bacterial mobilisation protein (MobC)